MEHWDLNAAGAEPHAPQILSTAADARTIALRLPAGEELQEHSVHEHARIVIIAGEVEVGTPDGETLAAGSGHLLEFEPGERRTIAARGDALLLILLSPWPGDGHPGAMSLEQKRAVRERAAEHAAGAEPEGR